MARPTLNRRIRGAAEIGELSQNGTVGRASSGKGNPEEIAIAASNVLGRTAASALKGLTPTEQRTILGVESGSTGDQTGAEIKTAYEGEDSVEHLLSTTVVDMKTVAAPTIYTVPASKILVITKVVVRTPTASLAGGVDYDIGDKVGTNFFKSTADLSALTTVTSYMVITTDNAALKTHVAAVVIAIDVITGSTAAANATIELFGYLIAA